MADATKKKSHKEWRKEAKKYRRKRIRQALAKKRDANLNNNDSKHQERLQEENEEELRIRNEEIEKQIHDEEERKWLQRERLIQQKIRVEQEKQRLKCMERDKQLVQTEISKISQNSLNNVSSQRKIVIIQPPSNENFMKKILSFVEGGPIPSELLDKYETNPGKGICLFFSKTGSCKYGNKCARNHIRFAISKILLLPHFFNHIYFDQNKATEYGDDVLLEFSDAELHRDYEQFFDDVIPELQKFGEIRNFRTSQNFEPHLRGNVYVEYFNERDAAKAFTNLQGRYYASKQINVEFCTLTSWKMALCGLNMIKKCPKGKHCNFIHTFRNPKNQFNEPIVTNDTIRKNAVTLTEFNSSTNLSWDNENSKETRNHWRWSESPEPHTNVEESTKDKRLSPELNLSSEYTNSKPNKQFIEKLDNNKRSHSSVEKESSSKHDRKHKKHKHKHKHKHKKNKK